MKNLLLILFLSALFACSSHESARRLRSEAATSPVSDTASLREKIQTLLSKSEDIDETKKKELERIFEEKLQKTKQLLEHSYKLRAVLIKELLTSPRNDKAIALLKKDIEKAEALRLENTFTTIDRVKELLGAQAEKDSVYDHLLMNRSDR